jgi:hypothetical protein
MLLDGDPGKADHYHCLDNDRLRLLTAPEQWRDPDRPSMASSQDGHAQGQCKVSGFAVLPLCQSKRPMQTLCG